MVMRSNKKPPWGPGPPASQAPPSSAEGGKSSRRQPCCCCPVTVQKEQQGIFRCRAGVGGQGSHEAMESPQALIAPLRETVWKVKYSSVRIENPLLALYRGTEYFCLARTFRTVWRGGRSGGLTSRHQTTGRVRVFATANTWRTQRPRGASGFGTESQWKK